MLISALRVTPLRLALKTPYIWSQGVEEAFTVNLIEIEAADGTIGYGETTTAPDADAQAMILRKLSRHFIGQPVADFTRLAQEAYRANFLTFGGNMPRFFNQLRSGLEMAALDLQGKLLGLPVWDLLGGAVRQDVGYFYFLQGESVTEIAADAQQAAAMGEPVIYLKVGVGEAHDMAAVKAVRAAIGNTRLRLDANEAWDVATSLRMIAAFAPYDVEYIEQPTPSTSQAALAQVAARSPIAIGADQSVFTLQEVHTAATVHRADLIAVGPREIGGLRPMMKAAAVAEAAGLNICIHSSMTTGITTCAEHHLGRAIPNLDDGNQIMWQLLAEDIVASPALTPSRGRLALAAKPGLGFELDRDAIGRAKAAHQRFTGA